MNTLLHNSVFYWLATRKHTVMVAALICLATMTVSCRSAKGIQTEVRTEYVHDTTMVEVHDTTNVLDVRYDSVDRYVEKTVYVDTNGVVHEKEIERLTKIVNTQSEESKAREYIYQKRIEELSSQLENNQKEVYIEKPLKGWQKMMMWFGVGFILVIIGFGISAYFNITKKK